MSTTTTVQAPPGALEFVGRLTLPSGKPLGSSFHTDPWLVDILNLALSGMYQQLWVELARGCAKTTLAAAISVVEGLAVSGTHVICIAADADQARILLEAVAGLIRRSPRLQESIHQTRSEFRFTNGSFIRVMSSDTASFFGIGAAANRVIIIADEVGQWVSPNLWYAAVSTLGKHEGNRLLALTNAGISGSWQQEARAAVEAAGGYVYAIPGCPASWITEERLEQMKASLPEPIFRRYYMNEWVADQGQFVEMALWDACRAYLPPLDDGTPVVIGADAAVVGDCWACVAVTRDPDRPEDAVAVRAVKIWTPPPGGAIDFQGPWGWLQEFCKSHDVAQISYDVYQLHDFMTRFRREQGIWCRPFPQMGDRAKADSDLFQLIRGGRLKHDGDPGLREHISNCAFKITPSEDSRARLVKRGKGKIDAAVALSMASSECLRLNL